jgi:hypothetical protein
MRTVLRQTPPRRTKVVPRIGILPPMVAALPIATFETLKPHAIDIRVNIDPVHWFLSPAKDTRSSLYLEDAATEFQVQGLELDWTIVTWDADLSWSGDGYKANFPKRGLLTRWNSSHETGINHFPPRRACA